MGVISCVGGTAISLFLLNGYLFVYRFPGALCEGFADNRPRTLCGTTINAFGVSFPTCSLTEYLPFFIGESTLLAVTRFPESHP